MVVSVTLWPFTHFLVKKYSLSNECFSLLFGASLISLAHNIPHHSPIFITNKDTVTTLPKVAYNEPLRAEQHCTYTSVSCEVSKMTTPLSVVRVCLVNTVFTAGSVPHYLTFDFSLSTLFTPSFNSRCFRRRPCRLWVDSAHPWAGKQEGRIPCWRSELEVFLSCRYCVTPPMIFSSTWLLLSQPNDMHLNFPDWNVFI